MKKQFILSVLLIHSISIWSQEKTEYEMLPLQQPSENPLETAEGLMRCLNLYIAASINIQIFCGLTDWRKKNEGRKLEFKDSEQFKTCGGSNKISEDFKLRNIYSEKFMQTAHLIVLDEGVQIETLYLNADEQVDTYYLMIQDSVSSEVMTKQEIEGSFPILFNDLSTCMTYRDYVESDEEGRLKEPK